MSSTISSFDKPQNYYSVKRASHKRPRSSLPDDDLEARALDNPQSNYSARRASYKRPRSSLPDEDLRNWLEARAHVDPRCIITITYEQSAAPYKSRQGQWKNQPKKNQCQKRGSQDISKIHIKTAEQHQQDPNKTKTQIKTTEEMLQDKKVKKLHNSTRLSKKVLRGLLENCEWDLKRAKCEAQRIRTEKLERKAREASARLFEAKLASVIIFLGNMKISSV